MYNDYYATWEWQPIERIPDGCNDIEVKTTDGYVEDMCSCDYWWLPECHKQDITSFRFI